MVDAAPPSNNPANERSLYAAITYAMETYTMGLDGQLPAQIISYNRTTNRAKVQIMVPMVTTGNQVQQRAEVVNVPVLQLGGGGFILSVPVKVGDLGWLEASDRDISIFKKTYGSTAGPPTQRLREFSDARFIPDNMMRAVTLATEDAGNLVIQNLAGTVKLAFWSTFMKIIGALGIGTSPNANAIFHIASTTKASIPWPLMTSTQRDAIPGPQEGMAIWNISNHSLSVYNGSSWS